MKADNDALVIFKMECFFYQESCLTDSQVISLDSFSVETNPILLPSNLDRTFPYKAYIFSYHQNKVI